MRAPKGILMLVEVNSSKRDLYGNCYHYGTVTNTRTGQSLTFNMDTESNTAHSVAAAMRKVYSSIDSLGWDRLKVTHNGGVPIREFKRRAKGLPYEYRVDFEALVTGKGEALKPAPVKK